MTLKLSGFAVLISLTLLAGIAIQTAHGQIQPRQIIRIANAPDYHLLHTSDHVYRFDSKTGLTQRLVTSSEGGTGKNIKYDWATILDTKADPAGDAGKYEVVEGTGSSGILVRTDNASGKTWVAIQTNILNWQEATAK